MARLLSKDALHGVVVGVSVSPSDDLGRLGLLEDHFRLALGEITRAVLVAGGGLIYGGHLRPTGYTGFLLSELHRYADLEAQGDAPALQLCLAWQEHRRMPLAELERVDKSLNLFGSLTCLDVHGHPVARDLDRGEAPAPVDESLVPQALTGLRRYMTQHQHGRVFIGGRRKQAEGVTAGLVEEAVMALEADQPIYLAGGFGGATLDISGALGIDDGGWLPRTVEEQTDGRNLVEQLAGRPGRRGRHNGLTVEQNRWLAASHRPGDIAALVTLGLGVLHDDPGPAAEEVDPPLPCLPTYLVIDTSESMRANEDQLAFSIDAMLRYLRTGGDLTQFAPLSVITFDDEARLVQPMAFVDDSVQTPVVRCSGGTRYGPMFRLLRTVIDDDVATLAGAGRRVLRPAVFLLTDGDPQDGDWQEAHQQLVDTDRPLRPHIITYGFGDASGGLVRQLATSVSFLATPSLSQDEAISTSIGSMFNTLAYSAPTGRLELPTVVAGFDTVDVSPEPAG